MQLIMKKYSLTKNVVASYSMCDMSLDISCVPSNARVSLPFYGSVFYVYFWHISFHVWLHIVSADVFI